MKKTKKQRRSETLVKFHKGILKLSISEGGYYGSEKAVRTVGKRKDCKFITTKSDVFRKIFWAVDSKLNYKLYTWIPSQVKKFVK